MDPFVPQFYENVHFYPVYKQDGKTPNTDHSYVSYAQRRQFATQTTAEWIGKEYDAEQVYAKPYLGMGVAYDINEQEVQQYMVTIQGHEITAGELAYYFTQRLPGEDVSQENQTMDERGMWPSTMPIEQVMVEGKKAADKWLAQLVQA